MVKIKLEVLCEREESVCVRLLITDADSGMIVLCWSH